eukprot:m.163099 g.163099  ORF g.163099 m.163099 type:complete len:245 (+) comp14621_c0_seq2:76-810(+)
MPGADGAAAPVAPPQYAKVDNSGTFLRFPGITAVCDMTDAAAAATVHSAARELPELGAAVAWLPASSYHVTILDVCCQYKLAQSDGDWANTLGDHDRWQPAAELVAAAAWAPGLRVKRVSLYGSCVGVDLEPLPESLTPEHPSHTRVGSELAEWLNVPPQKQSWHFTLGYAREKGVFDRLDPVALENDRAVLERAVRSAYVGRITLATATLCQFEDMTAFVPWDGLSKEKLEAATTLDSRFVTR